MFEFSELRPSYNNFLEFVRLGYRPEYINIYLGFLVVLAASVYVLRAKQNFHVKLLAWYFSLSFFTNFAYQMYGVRFFDFLGVIISLIVILIILNKSLEILFFEKVFFILVSITFLHLLILYGVGYLDKYDDADRIFFQKLVMVLRLYVLFFIVLYFTNYVKSEGHINFIINDVQIHRNGNSFYYVSSRNFVFRFWCSTVGLNFASGQIPIPRFASVAVEGGHFGRLIPTFLIYFMARKKGRIIVTPFFCLLLILSITNISSSFYGYLFFIFLSVTIVNMFIFNIRGFKTLLAMAVLMSAIITLYYYDYVLLFYKKLVGLFFHTDPAYLHLSYRSIDFLFKSLSEFPFGIGFGVSNRFLPDGSVTDNGIYAIISQLSMLSIVFIFIFVYYLLTMTRCFIRYKETLVNKAYATHSFVMVLAIPFIFLLDIVWLYPGYILPFLVLITYIKKEEHKEIEGMSGFCPT